MIGNILIGTDSLPLGAPVPGVTEAIPEPEVAEEPTEEVEPVDE
jgi:hypothetical protein